MNILTIVTVALCYGIWERSPWVRPRTPGRDLESSGFKADSAIFCPRLQQWYETSEVSCFCFRSRLAIIPQDAFLFSGAVRDNLDPWKRVSGVCIHYYCYSRETSLCLRSTWETAYHLHRFFLAAVRCRRHIGLAGYSCEALIPRCPSVQQNFCRAAPNTKSQNV